MKPKPPQVWTGKEALEKLMRFCAYQERSRLQIIRKIKLLSIPEEWQDDLLSKLEAENFLNEDRFKKAFVRGKSRVKGWGPLKIEQSLFQETGQKTSISQILNQEDEKKSMEKLEKDLGKKLVQLQSKNDKDWFNKMIRFCLSRGFTLETAMETINKMNINKNSLS